MFEEMRILSIQLVYLFNLFYLNLFSVHQNLSTPFIGVYLWFLHFPLAAGAMAFLTRSSAHRIPLQLASAQRALALHTTVPSLSSTSSSSAPTSYAQAPPPSITSPGGISKTAEFVISKSR
ncbi:hypothetical protein G4B88_007013 [Cannabis sativa]|uniref:Uncharacterized protein n=1 Tax=Cannabis sativa TaxID=3483 RepID=A0A7J6FQW9_CANSA|nr:hypothetical protein G4B88_007013 [Cannabis sativa]